MCGTTSLLGWGIVQIHTPHLSMLTLPSYFHVISTPHPPQLCSTTVFLGCPDKDSHFTHSCSHNLSNVLAPSQVKTLTPIQFAPITPSYLILCRSLGIRCQTSLRQCWRISSPAFCRRMSPSGLVTCAVVPTTSSPTSGSAPSTGWTCSTGEGLRLSGHRRGVSATSASTPLATPQQWWRSPTTTSLRKSSKIFDYRAPK